MISSFENCPDNWSMLKIDEIAIIQSGTGFPPDAQGLTSGTIPFLKVSDMNLPKNSRFIEEWNNSITEEQVSKLKAKILPPGAVIFPKIGGAIATNKKRVLTIPSCFDNNVMGLKAKQGVLDEYLYWLLQSIDLVSWSSSSSLPSMKASTVKEFFVPVPSMAEQKYIVEKLDALFTRIDTAIEHLHSKLDLSKQLFDSILDEFFKLPECDAVPLTEVVDFIGGSQPPKSQFSDIQKEGYVRLIQIRDYKSDNYIVYVDSASTKKFCTKDDVMIGRYGPPVFQILRGLDGAYNVALMKAVPNEDVLTKDYLFWFLQSPSIQNYVIGISQRAAGQSGVNKKALEKYLIPVPSKTMQNDIVDKVGQLVSKSRDLEAEVTAEIASLNQLKASILDSAFKGEL